MVYGRSFTCLGSMKSIRYGQMVAAHLRRSASSTSAIALPAVRTIALATYETYKPIIAKCHTLRDMYGRPGQ